MLNSGSLANYLGAPRALTWGRCTENQWCPLMNLNLDHEYFSGMEGVYIIWHGGNQPQTLYVGQGSIAARLRWHREDPRFTPYLHHGLFTTWARVEALSRPGIERYLIDTLTPILNDQRPTASPIPVALPWSS